MKVIIVNGPPRSGKGVLVGHLLKHLPNAVYCSFKEPLYQELMSEYLLSREELMRLVDGPTKDVGNRLFNGLTPRAAIIEKDKELKKRHGDMIIAKRVIDAILDTPDYGRKTFVFPDGGVGNEVPFAMNILKHYGLLDFSIVQVRRKGCDFTGDTRKYIDNPSMVIHNDVNEKPGHEGNHMYEQFIRHYNA